MLVQGTCQSAESLHIQPWSTCQEVVSLILFNAGLTEQAGLVGVESRHPDDLDLVDNGNLFVSFLLNNSPYVINHLNE